MTEPVLVNTLNQRTWNGRQSTMYDELLEMRYPGASLSRCSIRIEVDSYDFQSSAVIKRWDGSGWQLAAAIPYAKMASLTLFYQREHEPHAFATDRDELVRLAALSIYGARWEQR